MMKIAFILLLVASVFADPPSCLPNVKSGKCYKLYEGEYHGYDRLQAEELCEKNGGSLAIFETKNDYDTVYDELLKMKPGTMILTGLTYKPGVSTDRPLYKSGGAYKTVSFKPKWFEGHPISKKGHSEVIVIPSKSDDYSGMMNSEDGCRYDLVLCQE